MESEECVATVQTAYLVKLSPMLLSKRNLDLFLNLIGQHKSMQRYSSSLCQCWYLVSRFNISFTTELLGRIKIQNVVALFVLLSFFLSSSFYLFCIWIHFMFSLCFSLLFLRWFGSWVALYHPQRILNYVFCQYSASKLAFFVSHSQRKTIRN